MKRPPALRVRVPDAVIAYTDGVVGSVRQNLAREVGDFVLRRGDGVYAYQLAVAVDDADSSITDVVRGADLVSSTPRQIWLIETLGGTPPRYVHVGLVVHTDGQRLEKRRGSSSIGALRSGGISASRILGVLAQGLGLVAVDAPTAAKDLAVGDGPITWRRDPWSEPASW